jgi:hypothetical protein
MTIPGIASASLEKCRNPLQWGNIVRVKAKRGNFRCPSSWNPRGEKPKSKPRRTKEIQNVWLVLL